MQITTRVTHLEPGILETGSRGSQVALRKHYYKASGSDGIPAELSKILKDDVVKLLHSVSEQIWKTQQWPQDWKRSVSIQSQRRAVPKNVQTTIELCSFHAS